jgi:NHLM bacteriocin system ABC transporter ATP-binding protein
MTIGRGTDCDIVLQDASVSRHHAVIESTPTGFRVRDTGSANGIVVSQRRESDVPLAHGIQFTIGETVFEFVDPPAEPAPTSSREFVVRIVEATIPEAIGKEFTVSGSVSIGRDPKCAVPLKDRSASHRHAFVQAVDDGFRIIDNSSVNGVWLDDRRVTDAVISDGQRFRIGDTFLECHSLEAESDPTMVMADLNQLMAKAAARQLSDAGEAISVSGSQALLLDDPGFAYYVASGNVEIFFVRVTDGQPTGRKHFVTVPEGEAFFGMDIRSSGEAGFLALSKSGTVVRRIPRDRLASFGADPSMAATVVRVVDAWVTRLSRRLIEEIDYRPLADVSIEAGKVAQLAAGRRARAAADVAWIDVEPDVLLYLNVIPLPGDDAGGSCSFPLTSLTWVEPESDSSGSVTINSRSTVGLFAEPAKLWQGIDAFHCALCQGAFINIRLTVLDEFDRLQKKQEHSEEARDQAMDAIGAVLVGGAETVAMAPVGSVKPLVEACRLVATFHGLKVSPPGESQVKRTLNEQVLAIAAASRFRTRQVALRGDWWNHDQGGILAIVAQTNSPVALLPKGPRRYEMAEPATGERRPVTPALAATLEPFGYSFYVPLPVGKLGARELVRFGARGMAPDFRLLALMGVATGVFGAVTPYLIGRMVDGAIPQGDRRLLVQLSLAMLLAALANAAFKITQSISVVRIESRLDYVLASAIWDRLLDLPSGFFRQFGAGDLADRAGGVNAIRGVISRAGVGGILGGFSSVAYIVLMLTYNVQLTLVAIVISLVLVSVTTTGNYRQLRYQRNESRQRGRIMSLVLQLVTGVAKVRVCAAENHAFRVWAHQFSTSKRTGFSIGQVQNVVGTFTSSFAVMSSIGIFATLYYIQTSVAGMTPPFTTGTFIAFNGAYGAFVAALQALSDASMSLLKAVPTFERLTPILDTAPESDETKLSPGKLRGEITVSHLHFRYRPEMPWVIKDVSFTIKAGQMVAFVGSSGCGKSTLLRLLLGFERPQSGSIAFDGQDLATLDVRAVRQQMGVVLQESRVLPTDIFRNIVGATAHTMDDAWEAASMAGLADDIRDMPMGMHTIVSEGGGTFSGGQRQRLLIARALVNKPSLIFFDEATSALDNRAQAVVTQSMDSLKASRIVIAHRLSTVVNADRIFYFEGGEIREEGTYQQLLARRGAFAALAKRQIA